MSDKNKQNTSGSKSNNTPAKPDIKITFPQSVYIKNSDQRISSVTNKKTDVKKK